MDDNKEAARKLITPQANETRFIFFGGKGGVGKSVSSAATAIWLADQGYKTLLVSTDLQKSFSDIFEREIGYRYAEIEDVPNLIVTEADPKTLVQEHWEKMIGHLKYAMGDSIVWDFLEKDVSPCLMEMAAFYKLTEFFTEESKHADVIIFDTAPSGQAIMLINLPLVWAKREAQLQERKPAWTKVGFWGKVSVTFVGETGKMIQEIDEKTNKTSELLQDKNHTTFLYVLWPESLPITETERSVNEIRDYGIDVAGIIVNEILPEEEIEKAGTEYFKKRQDMQQKYVKMVEEKFGEKVILHVPLMETEVKGVDMLRKLSKILYS